MPLTMAVETLHFRNYMHRKGVEHVMVNVRWGYFLIGTADFKISVIDITVKV